LPLAFCFWGSAMKWLVAGAAAIMTATGTAIVAIPAPKDPIVLENQFDEAWGDVMRVVALQKADRIRSIPLEKPVIAERVVPQPSAVVPPALSLPDEGPPVAKRRRHAGRDICRGKGRYYTHGGKSWRCRR